VEHVYSLMDSPKPPASYDLTKILADRKTDPRGMVKYGEKFFMSLGLRRCQRRFGRDRFSRNQRIATWCAMPARGTWI